MVDEVKQETETETTGTTEQPETVSVEEATEEEIDAAMRDLLAQEEAQGEQPEPEETATAKQEAKPEPKPEEEKKPSQEEKFTLTREQWDDLQRRLEKNEKQTQSQEQLLKRRQTELGDIRKVLRERIDGLKKGLEEKELTSPREVVKDTLAIQEAEKKLDDVDAEEARLTQAVQTEQIVKHYCNFDEAGIEDMAEALAQDGFDENYVKAFKQTPWFAGSADALIHLHRRARAEKALKVVLPYAKNLFEENKKLKDEASKLRKAPADVLTKVEQALKTQPQVTGANGGAASGKSKTLSPGDITRLSDKELDELLAQAD